jgi:SSS family solute:Na+ symporter
MVPAGILLLTAATLIAKNVYAPIRGLPADDPRLMGVSRAMMILIACVALALALWSPAELVNLLILGYDGVSQFFPGIVLGLWTGVTAGPVVLGLLAGETVVVALIWSRHDPWLGLNAGFVGLAVNVLVTLVTMTAFDARRKAAAKAERRVAQGNTRD